jgi:uridine kinase
VLVFDGLFIHRPELRRYWDYSIYLDASPRTPPAPEQLGGLAARYVGGWRLYVDECDPASLATIVVDNSDWASPALRKAGSSEA